MYIQAGSGGGGGETRVAPDGNRYTQAEFVTFFGGYTEWDAAAPAGSGGGNGAGNVASNGDGGAGGAERITEPFASRHVAAAVEQLPAWKQQLQQFYAHG